MSAGGGGLSPTKVADRIAERARTEGVEVGIVTSIVGLLALSVMLRGETNHAGTTPMDRRRDALVGAARITHRLRDLARQTAGMTANVGTIAVEPGWKNVVPGVSSGALRFGIDCHLWRPSLDQILTRAALYTAPSPNVDVSAKR